MVAAVEVILLVKRMFQELLVVRVVVAPTVEPVVQELPIKDLMVAKDTPLIHTVVAVVAVLVK